jgi:hypothetical protein
MFFFDCSFFGLLYGDESVLEGMMAYGDGEKKKKVWLFGQRRELKLLFLFRLVQ